MGCPQRFYLGEIRNQIAFTPPTQGTYNIALTKTDAGGTSTVATSVADVDTPAGWTQVYTTFDYEITTDVDDFGGIETVYNGVSTNWSEGIEGSGQIYYTPLHGDKTITLHLDHLPKHAYLNASGGLVINHQNYPEGSRMKTYVDGELVNDQLIDGTMDGLLVSRILPHTKSSATVTIVVTGLTSSDTWWVDAGVNTFLPTVSLSVDKDHVSEAGLEDTSNPNGLHERTISFTATRSIPYTTAEYNAMTPAVRDLIFPSMSVPVKWSGEAANGNDVSALPDSIVIPAGSLSGDVKIVAADDAVPEFTEKLTATISAPDNYIVPYLDQEKTVEIVDNDLELKNIPKYTVLGKLYEVDVVHPSGASGDKAGATIQLNWNNAELHIFLDHEKNEPLYPGLEHHGFWTVGTDVLPDKIYIESVGQSNQGNDTFIYFTDDDSTSTQPPSHATRNDRRYSLTRNRNKIQGNNQNEAAGDIWWFGGADAMNFEESLDLSFKGEVEDVGSTYSWSIEGNKGAADFVIQGVNLGDSVPSVALTTSPAPSVHIVSTGLSSAMTPNDVHVVLRIKRPNDAVESIAAIWNVTVHAPTSVKLVNHDPYPYRDNSNAVKHETVIGMRIDDQYGIPVPFALEVHEEFEEPLQFMNNNWTAPISQGQPMTFQPSYPWATTPSYFADTYGLSKNGAGNSALPNPMPVMPNDINASTLVQTCVQSYWVGSHEIGHGLKVEEHTVKFYLGMTRWNND